MSYAVSLTVASDDGVPAVGMALLYALAEESGLHLTDVCIYEVTEE